MQALPTGIKTNTGFMLQERLSSPSRTEGWMTSRTVKGKYGAGHLGHKSHLFRKYILRKRRLRYRKDKHG
jgi:hypothetical protein